MGRVKDAIKQVHGALYRAALPVIVRPPSVRRRGVVESDVRAAIRQFVDDWTPRIHGRVLDVGAGSWTYPRERLAPRCHYLAVDCRAVPGVDVVCDVHRLTSALAPGCADFVLCLDVFEHLERPWVAAREIHDVLRPGGTLLLTTPFNYWLHGEPAVKDYWRLTAHGLHVVLGEEAGFTDVEVAAIGNRRFPFSHTVVARRAPVRAPRT